MGTSTVRAHCLQILSLCCFFLCSSAAGNARMQLPSAMVVGTVYCDTCFNQEFSKSTHHLISGASVAVECGGAASTKPSFREEVKTNRHGVFRVRLPLEVSRHLKSIKACSVKLVKSSHPFCSVASSATSSGLRLKSRRNGVHVFSAGFFTFKPLKRPALCYQKPVLKRSPSFASLADEKPIQAGFFFPTPPIPFLPSPPNVGGIPLPPNPFQPPPSLLPPVFPSPPPSVLPPVFPAPPSSIIPFPPIGPLPLLPSPPPPPPVFRLPPFPFPPSPLFPGIPPAVSSKETSP